MKWPNTPRQQEPSGTWAEIVAGGLWYLLVCAVAAVIALLVAATESSASPVGWLLLSASAWL